MKLKINKKLLTLLACNSIILLSGCDTENIESITESNIVVSSNSIDDEEVMEEEKEVIELDISEEVEEEKEEWLTPKFITYIEVEKDTDLYKDIDGTYTICSVKKYDRFIKTNTYFDDYYEVISDNICGYIKKDDSKVTVELEYPTTPIRLVKLDKGSNIYYDPLLTDLIATYDDIDVGEVYQEIDGIYSIKTNDFYGYIRKDEVTMIPDKTLAVVDISDQLVKLYRNNEVVLKAPVVTGKPSTPTRLGEYNVYSKTENRYLIGPNYKYYVNVMMSFDNGIGLHDAEYHTDSNGKKHGSRTYEEFGGETYLTNGSHGCVNMRHDDALVAAQYVQEGTKVIVKQ